MRGLDLFYYPFSKHGFPPDKESIYALLDAHERERFERFKFDELRWTFATARWLVKTKAAHYLDVSPDALTLCYSEHGKPSFDQYHGIEFSISHTQQGILVGFSKQALGVDLEQIDRRGSPWLKSSSYLNPELAVIVDNCVSDDEKMRCFTRYWTSMEAKVKLGGETLFRVKESFGSGLPKLVHDGHYNDGQYHWYIADMGTGEQAATCSQQSVEQIDVYVFNGQQFVVDTGLADVMMNQQMSS